jgi:hypothetical protein
VRADFFPVDLESDVGKRGVGQQGLHCLARHKRSC